MAADTNKLGPHQNEKYSSARAAVLASMVDPAPDERVLLELVANQLPLVEMLEGAQKKAAERLVQLLDSPNSALAFARLLREVTTLNGSIGKRIGELLQAASNLRTQRRVLQIHGKGGANEK